MHPDTCPYCEAQQPSEQMLHQHFRNLRPVVNDDAVEGARHAVNVAAAAIAKGEEPPWRQKMEMGERTLTLKETLERYHLDQFVSIRAEELANEG